VPRLCAAYATAISMRCDTATIAMNRAMAISGAMVMSGAMAMSGARMRVSALESWWRTTKLAPESGRSKSAR